MPLARKTTGTRSGKSSLAFPVPHQTGVAGYADLEVADVQRNVCVQDILRSFREEVPLRNQPCLSSPADTSTTYTCLGHAIPIASVPVA
jgi:hypothetical protein